MVLVRFSYDIDSALGVPLDHSESIQESGFPITMKSRVLMSFELGQRSHHHFQLEILCIWSPAWRLLDLTIQDFWNEEFRLFQIMIYNIPLSFLQVSESRIELSSAVFKCYVQGWDQVLAKIDPDTLKDLCHPQLLVGYNSLKNIEIAHFILVTPYTLFSMLYNILYLLCTDERVKVASRNVN